ncbi:MAG: hypothetical protein JNL11_09400 [Bdellovibrionaceae bacterium]|nr:hypothetical protein [Pseudobdellovibrionaceae bacterium]
MGCISIRKILILGSIASGKTRLARQLGLLLSLPVIHVDQLEFNPDLSKRKIQDIRIDVQTAVSASEWILDGHGPLDILPQHLERVHLVIYLDFPLWLNIFRLCWRQLGVLFKPRSEMPRGANEWQRGHFKKMYQTLRKQHRLMNPELLRILQKPENKKKLIHVRTSRDWAKISQQVLATSVSKSF